MPFILPAPGVLANVSNPTGVVLAVVNFTQPTNSCGTVAIAPNGSLSLVPAADYFGNCSFTFAVLDDVGSLVQATVQVQIGGFTTHTWLPDRCQMEVANDVQAWGVCFVCPC